LSIAGAGGMFINPSPAEWVEYWRVMWGQTLLPAVFGLHLPAAGLTHGQVIEGVLLEVVAAGAITVSIRRKPRAWRAWAVLLIAVLANGILVAGERVVVLHSAAATAGDTRYLLDFSWLVPLLLALAFSPAQRFWPRAERLGVRLALPSPGRARVIGLGVLGLAVAYVLAAQVSTAALQRAWQGSAALAYEQNLQNSLARYRGGASPVIADAETPYEVLASIFAPYDHLSYVLPFYAPGAQVDGPLRGRLLVAGASGELAPAAVHTLETFAFPSGACETGVVPGGRTLTQAITVHPAPAQGPFYLKVDYGRTDAPYLLNTTRQDPPVGADASIPLSPGVGSSIGLLGATLPAELRVEIPPEATVCLRSLQIISLAPQRLG
jgi:hypothetical protein